MQWKNKCGGRNAKRGTARRAAVVIMTVLAATVSVACGPYFPNMMLVGGDGPVLTAPGVWFHREMDRALARLKITAPPFPYVSPTNSSAEATRRADLADLRAALKRRADEEPAVEPLVEAYAEARQKLLNFGEARTAGENCPCDSDGEPRNPAPAFPDVRMPAGLPAEFADYFRGALAWHRGHTNMARTHWDALLARPAAERQFKSTWAAFMLAKSWEHEDAAKARANYSLVRTLAKSGFPDSLGLAAASIGWEARVCLHAGEHERAMELYLQQLALGDETAYQSLRTVVFMALEKAPENLEMLVANPRCRTVFMADLISSGSARFSLADTSKGTSALLEAIEHAGLTDVDAAEQLALLQYQLGNFEFAQRWVNRSTNAPVSQWIQAKLCLRDGRVKQAATILGQLTRVFPLVEPTNAPGHRLFESLLIARDESVLPTGRQLRGELGVLHLHRREYAQALDALLRAGFWVDAAYVAERVLTTDEFKNYVDSHWPEVMKDTEEDKELPGDLKPSVQSRQIRYVLARRLARDARGAEARHYFPPEQLAEYDQFIQYVTAALNASTPREQRITNHYAAAYLIRHRGMEMIGTEVQPDFTCWAGNFEAGPTWQDRATNAAASVAGATQDEIERAQAHGTQPDQRWHYRAFAPGLRAEARILEFELRLEEVMKLPRNTDETAMAFYKLGKGAPTLDLADIAYKQLVRRCRKTELGEAADRQRWFPPFDEKGKPIVTRQPKAENKTPEAAGPPPAGN